MRSGLAPAKYRKCLTAPSRGRRVLLGWSSLSAIALVSTPAVGLNRTENLRRSRSHRLPSRGSASRTPCSSTALTWEDRQVVTQGLRNSASAGASTAKFAPTIRLVRSAGTGSDSQPARTWSPATSRLGEQLRVGSRPAAPRLGVITSDRFQDRRLRQLGPPDVSVPGRSARRSIRRTRNPPRRRGAGRRRPRRHAARPRRPDSVGMVLRRRTHLINGRRSSRSTVGVVTSCLRLVFDARDFHFMRCRHPRLRHQSPNVMPSTPPSLRATHISLLTGSTQLRHQKLECRTATTGHQLAEWSDRNCNELAIGRCVWPPKSQMSPAAEPIGVQ